MHQHQFHNGSDQKNELKFLDKNDQDDDDNTSHIKMCKIPFSKRHQLWLTCNAVVNGQIWIFGDSVATNLEIQHNREIVYINTLVWDCGEGYFHRVVSKTSFPVFNHPVWMNR